jgi:Ulp1 family protease
MNTSNSGTYSTPTTPKAFSAPPLVPLTPPSSITSLTSNTPTTQHVQPLTDEEHVIVNTIFNQPPSNSVVSHPSQPQVTVRNIQTLRAHTWINDEVINCFGRLLDTRDGTLKRINFHNPHTKTRFYGNSHFYTLLADQQDANPSKCGYCYDKVA